MEGGGEKVKILWMHDEFDGLENGLASYKDEKLWFRRSPDGGVDLFRLEEFELFLLEENHERFCKETGAPLAHGDVRKVRRKPAVKKEDLSSIAGEDGMAEVDFNKRPMNLVKKFSYDYEPTRLTGSPVISVKIEDISNFYVPRMVEYIPA